MTSSRCLRGSLGGMPAAMGLPCAWLLCACVLLLAATGCEDKAVSKEPNGPRFTPAKEPEAGPAKPAAQPNPADPKPAAPADPKPAGPDDPAPRPAIAEGGDPEHPYPRRLDVPEFPKDRVWLNTAGPLRLKKDLRGKYVLLDFWTYCCINCMHILPELKKLEQKYPKNLVVIGVHSAKFDTEKDTENIKEAILRYEIEHPVINDAEHEIWDTFGITSWPSLLLIDPAGQAVWFTNGEVKVEELSAVLEHGLPYYREKKLLDERPLHFELHASSAAETPLRFPGKVLADEAGKRLFIADSNHNRVVVSSLDGKLQAVIGSGAIGMADGDFAQASFNKPQGMFLDGERLYIADCENHMLRLADLKTKKVTTLAGTGQQGKGWPGLEDLPPFATIDDLPKSWVGPPLKTKLNSPWALWKRGELLYIAMAGPHQIWTMKVDGSEIGPYAGNGREDIVDGPLLPKIPFERGFSSFAQPSGLTADDQFLYVADSEGSSIRAVPFDATKEVTTVVGTAHLPGGRLFEFGDVDGTGEEVRLQHVLGVTHHAGQLYITDTYNNKIKVIDAASRTCKSIAGTGKAGKADSGAADGPAFDEPAGISHAGGKLYVADTNNHAIRIVDLAANNKVTTLTIAGLAPPPKPREGIPDFGGAQPVAVAAQTVAAKEGKITLKVDLALPAGWKLNDLAPMSYYVDAAVNGPLDRAALNRKVRLPKPATAFEIPLAAPTPGEETLQVGVIYYICQEGGEGACKVGSVLFTLPIKVAADATQSEIALKAALQ